MKRKKAMPIAPIDPVVTVQNYEFATLHSDAGGYGARWTCPDCLETVTWAPFAWWEIKCACRRWEFTISITGEALSVNERQK